VNASFKIHPIRDKLSIMPASTTIKQRYCEERWGLVKGSGGCKRCLWTAAKKISSHGGHGLVKGNEHILNPKI